MPEEFTPKQVLVFPAQPGPEPEEASPSAPVTRATLGEYVEGQTVRHAKRQLAELNRSLHRQMKGDSYKACELVAQMYGLVKSSGGIVINNLLQQNNFNEGDQVYFEGIIKRLEEQDRPSGEVIDAEVVEE